MTEHQDILGVYKRLDLIMAAQDDINAAVSAINGFLSDLSSDVAAIKAQLASGGSAAVDTSSLNTAVGQLPAAQAALDALVTPAGTTPPASASASSSTASLRR